MRREDFEFTIPKINPLRIEEKICDYCDVGYTHSSNVNKNMIQNRYIYASDGSVSCHIIIYETKDKKYNVSVSNIDVKKHKK